MRARWAFRWSRAMDELTDVAKRVRAAREETLAPAPRAARKLAAQHKL